MPDVRSAYALATPKPNIDRRFFFGLTGKLSKSFHGRSSCNRRRPPRPSRSLGELLQLTDSSEGAIDDAMMECASLSSLMVTRDSVLASDVSYKVGSVDSEDTD